MNRNIISRTSIVALLFMISVLLAACGQGDNSNAGVPASIPQATNTPASNIQATGTPANNAQDDTTVQASGDNGSSPTDVIGAEETATVLAGSDGSENTGKQGLDLTTLDPCTLLTADDVKSAIGDVPNTPKPQDQDAYHTACSYVEPTLEVNSPRLSVSIETTDNWELHTQDVQTVSGLGQEAQTHLFDGWRSLWVLLKNKAVVQIDIYPTDLAKAIGLATKVIGRLL